MGAKAIGSAFSGAGAGGRRRISDLSDEELTTLRDRTAGIAGVPGAMGGVGSMLVGLLGRQAAAELARRQTQRRRDELVQAPITHTKSRSDLFTRVRRLPRTGQTTTPVLQPMTGSAY